MISRCNTRMDPAGFVLQLMHRAVSCAVRIAVHGITNAHPSHSLMKRIALSEP
ncbi:hypothetical protein QSI_0486 [Clostridioides difficile P28]|nr:hypothetical protein QSI_0486 [Clostridioides difficile P28]